MRLKEIREKEKLLQRDVADFLKIAQTTYSGYETGYRKPTPDLLCKLADFFGVSVDYLLGRVDEPALFDDARVPKSEIQELYDEMTPTQQRRMIDFALGILAAGDVTADSPAKKRA